MGAQIVEIGGQKMAVLPVADYERLVELAEDRAEEEAASIAERRRADGEEYVPAELVDRILAGETPLRVWRQYRGLTLDDVAKRVGVTPATVSRLETGVMKGAPAIWRKLAAALDVTVEDILP
jgi:DNA-binding XRE family transcriptional regulator